MIIRRQKVRDVKKQHGFKLNFRMCIFYIPFRSCCHHPKNIQCRLHSPEKFISAIWLFLGLTAVNTTWLRLYRVRYPPLWNIPKRPCCLKCAHICLLAWCTCAPVHNWYIHNLLKNNCYLRFAFYLRCRYWYACSKEKKLPLGIWLGRFSPKSALGAIAGGIFRSHFGENIGRTDKLSRSC